MPRRALLRPNVEVVDVLTPAPAPAVTPADPPPAATPARPVPEQQLTPEQRRIRDLENQLALERGRKDPEPEFDPVPADAQETIRIHFVAEGLTALGQVWHRGQELEFVPGSAAYRDTCDRFGRSWLDLRDDPAAQEARWNEVKFRSGPWPGKSYADAAGARFESLAPLKEGQRLTPTEDELAKADKAEALRRRAAPRLPQL